MSARAFILIETVVGETKGVMAKLEHMEGVKSVERVTGPYDVIAVVQVENLSDIGELVESNIHPIAGISRTITCLAI